jgi:hypothetical protein
VFLLSKHTNVGKRIALAVAGILAVNPPREAEKFVLDERYLAGIKAA